jgi:hypothetical protein
MKHYITKYIRYAESWLQINIFGKCYVSINSAEGRKLEEEYSETIIPVRNFFRERFNNEY